MVMASVGSDQICQKASPWGHNFWWTSSKKYTLWVLVSYDFSFKILSSSWNLWILTTVISNFPVAPCVALWLRKSFKSSSFEFTVWTVSSRSVNSRFAWVSRSRRSTIKVKFGNDVFLLKVIRQIPDIVKSESCFSAPLRMPNNSLLDSVFNRFFYSFGSKNLRIAHDMFFQSVRLCFGSSLYISNAILEKHSKTIFAKSEVNILFVGVFGSLLIANSGECFMTFRLLSFSTTFSVSSSSGRRGLKYSFFLHSHLL